MGILDFLGNSLSGILDGVGGIIDRFKLSPEDKEKFKLELESLLQKRDSEIEMTYRKEIEAKKEILITELSQGDKYTKRARPSVIYVGLIFIFLNYVLIPIIQSVSGRTVEALSLPEEFWWAWGSIVATWSVGRSFEKTGIRNRLTGILTGSGSEKNIEAEG